MTEKEEKKHLLRLQYLDVLSKFSNTSLMEAAILKMLSLTDDARPTPDEPDLEEIRRQIKIKQQEAQAFNPTASTDFPATDLGEIVKKSAEISEQKQQNFQIDPSIDMVDPERKPTQQTEEPKQQQELQPNSNLPIIPRKYEDRMKMVENKQHQHGGQSVTPATDRVDARGFGESGGEIQNKGI